MVEIDGRASHHGSEAKRKSMARIRSHLIAGGYLHLTEWKSHGDLVRWSAGTIEELGLSAKAYDALIEAGIIPKRKRGTG
jgi:hypothetical protein